MQIPERVELGGLPFDRADLRSAAEYVVALAGSSQGGIVVPSNVATSRHMRNLGVPGLLERASFWPIDGVPLTWLLRVAGLGGFARVAGTDLMNEVVQRANERGVPVAIIGAAADLAVEHYRSLGMANVGGGDLPFAPEGSALLIDAASELLETDEVGICFVCLGFPKQEALALALRDRYPTWVFVGAGPGHR
ncbi:MAG: WecB/TagA/CpsF family glycosyltransferase [Propionibacteriaceae bacterium]|nr:WecB/TagA/CpsF family glycosyltransferase [Propionibacteriaceae bacterium]